MDKRTRGRPKLFDAETAAMLRKLGEIPETATARTLQNWMYFGRGVTLANSSPALAWLLPNGSCYKKKTLLSQLGRCRNKTAQAIFADRLCKLKPRTEDGIRLIRQWEARYQAIAAAHIADNEPITSQTVRAIALKSCKL